MRKNLTLLAAFMLTIGASAAVVGHNGSDGDMHIMGASGASATTATGPNGTSYYVEVSETGTEGNISNDTVTLVEKSENSINFTGKIQSPTPCQPIGHEIEERGDSLEIDIFLEAADGVCAQQVVMKNYEGFVEMEGLENVTVTHRGESMSVFETESGEPAKQEPKKRGFLSGVMNWFSGLF